MQDARKAPVCAAGASGRGWRQSQQAGSGDSQSPPCPEWPLGSYSIGRPARSSSAIRPSPPACLPQPPRQAQVGLLVEDLPAALGRLRADPLVAPRRQRGHLVAVALG